MVGSQTMPVDGQEAHNASNTPMAKFVSGYPQFTSEFAVLKERDSWRD